MNQTNHCIFSGMQILVNHHWERNQAVVVADGRIKSIIPEEMISHHLPAKHYAFPANYYLVPGFIDLHIHGAHGHDVMDGSEEALHKISHALAEEGVTGFLATTMTADNDYIENILKIIASIKPDSTSAKILGAHLEGPFIAKEKMGAQMGEKIQLPDVSLMKHWQKVAQGTIKIVTLAPELPGAIPLIKALRDMGIVASVGHTNATYDETCAAIAAGCTHATHLFNAMRGLHQREPGAVGALLLSEEVIAELIADGVHLHPAILQLILRLKGKDRLVLITDAMRAKCMGNGQYELGGQPVFVQDNLAKLSDGTLAGSVLRLPEAIKNMVKFSECSLADAIYMAATNPARVLGLEGSKGSIAVGKDADLVVMDAELGVQFTMREGREVFRL
jgi:N-acetylglucosamine-6-phosphate deacetylase